VPLCKGGTGFGGFSWPVFGLLLNWNTVGAILPLQAEFFYLFSSFQKDVKVLFLVPVFQVTTQLNWER
jgi:hypothetical protein